MLRTVPSFRDVSGDALHEDFFHFFVGPYYVTYPEGGVAGNCEFTREEWDAPYQPTFGVLTKEVFKDHGLEYGRYDVSKVWDTAYQVFLGVGTTFDIFQNILFPYRLNTAYCLSWIRRIGSCFLRGLCTLALVYAPNTLCVLILYVFCLIRMILPEPIHISKQMFASDSLKLPANVVLASAAVASEQNEEWVNSMVDGPDLEMTDGAAPAKSESVFAQGISYALDDVAGVTAVGSERVSSRPTNVVGEKGDGSLPSSAADEEATANP
nr:hypothetical protein [Tanacetum cinerariifolium]